MTHEELRKIAEAATPGPWKWWTSCSWRRLKHDRPGLSMNVAEPFIARDGHPDLDISEANATYIASFSPSTTRALLDQVQELREALEAIERCESQFSHDPLKRAVWAVEHCRKIASAAIAKVSGGKS
jgi:hypothetical protein